MSGGRPRRARLLAPLIAVVTGVVLVSPASASVSGPIVTLDRYEMAPGERVVMTIDGFAATSVTISVCGNEARRGSSDCNMTESTGRTLDRDGSSTMLELPIAAPPVPCPCLVRVSSPGNDEVAVAPITLIGHPVGEIVDGSVEDEPLSVAVEVRRAPVDLLGSVTSALGGATTYEVTVVVTNRSTGTFGNVSVSGFAGRDEDDVLTSLDLSDPGELAAGQRWEETVEAELPAPVFGAAEWRVSASGAGPTVTAAAATRHVPVLLLVLAAVFVVDLMLLTWRLVARRRRRSATRREEVDAPSHGEPLDDREPELVG